MQYIAILSKSQRKGINLVMHAISEITATGSILPNGILAEGQDVVTVVFTAGGNASMQTLQDLANYEYQKLQQPIETTLDLKYPTVGQRVEFTGVITRFDTFFQDMTGQQGTVSYVDEDNIWVKLDNHYPSLDEWDNCIHWNTDGDCPQTPCRPANVIVDFDFDVKFID